MTDLLKNADRAEQERLREAWRQQAEAELKAARAEAKAARRAARHAFWLARWPRWTAWWEARAREAKIAATVVGSVLAIAAGVPRLVKPVGQLARWAWSFYSHRDIGKTLPPPSGGASTALDRVDPPARP